MEIKDHTSVIFGNKIDKATIRSAEASKKKFIKKYGDEKDKVFHLKPEPIETLNFLGVNNLVLSPSKLTLEGKPLIVGNIRMGFGHYRISIAIASCAKYLGYTPYWLDLAGFDSTGSKMIREQNNLYSLASRISQKSHLFNALIWEPLNSEGFRQLTYNAKDQKNSELLAPLYNDLPKDVPFVATHAWPAQGAVHAGLTHVVNAIPDNWPMALHLSEGAIHAVQTPFAYLGYKMLNGMAKTPLNGMGDDDLYEVGHYVDHELVSNIVHDVKMRISRIKSMKPLRVLLSIGGAGAGTKQFTEIITHLLEYVKMGRVTILINLGDHHEMNDYFSEKIPGFKEEAKVQFDDYKKFKSFADKITNDDLDSGVYVFAHKNIFEAVYATNLLMRACDFLITKPSELAYYPVVKLMMKHIGGHEVYGAIHAQEIGDSTFECSTKKSMNQMIDTLLNDKGLLIHLNEQIIKLKEQGIYNGGYEVVKLAVKGHK